METVELVLASDNGAFCGLLVAACTAASCAAKNANLTFHILDGGIGDSDFEFFERCLSRSNPNASTDRIRVSQEDLKDCPSYHGSRMAYSRLLLPKLLPNLKRVLYFDTDFCWRADVVQLWSETQDVVSIAAATDQNPGNIKKESAWYALNGITFSGRPYFCTGSCVINLERWRKDNTTAQALDFIRKYPTVECAEQTALNVILKPEEVRILPACWDRFVRFMTPHEFQKPAALHFAAEAPWNASLATKMLTDAQLLWFKTDAELREISIWKSLRRCYSAMEIIRFRLTYILIMKVAPCRWLFHKLMARAGRCLFDERI